MHARGSDGHQNVLWSISYSPVVREQLKSESEKSSEEQDGSRQDITRTLLSENSHQHGLRLAAYRDVGNDYAVNNGQLAKGLEALEGFESVPRR